MLTNSIAAAAAAVMSWQRCDWFVMSKFFVQIVRSFHVQAINDPLNVTVMCNDKQ